MPVLVCVCDCRLRILNVVTNGSFFVFLQGFPAVIPAFFGPFVQTARS